MLPIGKMIPLQRCSMVIGAAQRDSGSVLPQRKLPSQRGEESNEKQGFTSPQCNQSPWNILSAFQQTRQGDFGQAKVYSLVYRCPLQGGRMQLEGCAAIPVSVLGK